MSDLKIAVMGAAGRMGRELVRAVHAAAGCEVIGGVEREGSPAVGQDIGPLAGLGPLGVPVTDDALELIARAYAVPVVPAHYSSVEFATLASNARRIPVLGTTGFSDEDEAAIAAAARHATIIKAGNMGLGVSLLVALTRKVAQALDEDFDIEILEMHHKHKVDAPSGTA